MSWIALAISLAALAFVLWNGRKMRKDRLRAQAANRRAWGAVAQTQLAALKAERLRDELRKHSRRSR